MVIKACDLSARHIGKGSSGDHRASVSIHGPF
jgi:hypothetical protein